MEALARADLNFFLQPLFEVFQELVIRRGKKLGDFGMNADDQRFIGVQVPFTADLA
jgi:hypothetical protein